MNARPGYAVLGLALLLCKTASAQPSASHAFRLAYDAPQGCPSADTVAAAIQSSSAKAHPAAQAEPAIDLLAFVTATEGGFLGVLRIRRPDGTETTRGVPAATCAEATSAMTLIAAIAVDPDAAVAAAENVGNAASVESEGAPPAAALAATRKPPVTSKETETAPKPAELETAEPSPVAASAQKHERPWQLAATAGVGIVGAMAPTLTPDFALGVEAGLTRRTFVSPWVRLSAHLAESAAANSSDGTGTARFEKLAGRITGCPVAARVGLAASPFVLRPCVLFEAGRLRASGSNAPNHKDVSLGWTAPGAVLRGELILVGPLTLGLELGALFPLSHDSFYFDPNRDNVVYRVGDVGFLGSLELGLKIL